MKSSLASKLLNLPKGRVLVRPETRQEILGVRDEFCLFILLAIDREKTYRKEACIGTQISVCLRIYVAPQRGDVYGAPAANRGSDRNRRGGDVRGDQTNGAT